MKTKAVEICYIYLPPEIQYFIWHMYCVGNFYIPTVTAFNKYWLSLYQRMKYTYSYVQQFPNFIYSDFFRVDVCLKWPEDAWSMSFDASFINTMLWLNLAENGNTAYGKKTPKKCLVRLPEKSAGIGTFWETSQLSLVFSALFVFLDAWFAINKSINTTEKVYVYLRAMYFYHVTTIYG